MRERILPEITLGWAILSIIFVFVFVVRWIFIGILIGPNLMLFELGAISGLILPILYWISLRRAKRDNNPLPHKNLIAILIIPSVAMFLFFVYVWVGIASS